MSQSGDDAEESESDTMTQGAGLMQADIDTDLKETAPVEWIWLLVTRKRSENHCIKLVPYCIFVVVFTMILQMVRPVRAMFTVQDTLLEHTARYPFPQATWAKTFYDISNDADWWEWVETVLVPNTLTDTYFNGDSRGATWGSRFLNTVGEYNTQTAPMRFRQARVTDDSCGTPGGHSQLARPCWGAFTTSRQFKQNFGADYGNRFLIDLNSISGKEGFGVNYGTEAHVVDAPLNKARALDLVSKMKSGIWINEQTRALTIETNWYNANLDISTYCMWHIDITPGGYFAPYVIVHSCRLSPYANLTDYIRACLEIFFCVTVIGLWIEWIAEMARSTDKKAFIMNIWNVLELVNLLFFVLYVVFWFVYMFKDKEPFRTLSTKTYNARPDLSGVASQFNLTVNFASFNIIFSYVKIFNHMQVFPSVGMLWRTLELSLMDMFAFLVVFLLFICGFTFAGHWIFGFRMIEFHNWGDSFVTLFQSFTGGLPYETMSQVAPVSAALFTVAWVLMMAIVLASMFVAILVHCYFESSAEMDDQNTKLSEKARSAANYTITQLLIKRILELVRRPGPKAADDTEVEQHMRKAIEHLSSADSRDKPTIDMIRKAVAEETELNVASLTRYFKGDEKQAGQFVHKVRELADADSKNADEVRNFTPKEIEVQELERLQKLQVTMQRLEEHMQQLRGALHESCVGRLQEGQSLEGYSVDAPALSVTDLPMLPGAVNS